MNKKTSAIILIERTKLTYYGINQGSAFVFPFAPEVVRDLDIVNKSQFDTALKTFIQTQKLTPANIVILMADEVLFETDIITAPQIPPVQASGKSTQPVSQAPKLPDSPLPEISQEEKIKAFIESVPFENSMVKTYVITKGIKVAVVNRDMYESVKKSFSSIGSTVEAVVPVFLVKAAGITTPMGPNELRKALSQAEFLKQQSFSLQSDEQKAALEKEKVGIFTLTVHKGGNAKRLAALIGIFIILLGIMVVLYLNVNKTSSIVSHASSILTKPSVPAIWLSPTIKPTIDLSPSVSASPSGVLDQSIKIHIESSAGSLQAKSLQIALTTNGWRNTIFTTQSGNAPGQSLILFAQSVTPEAKEKITQIVQIFYPQATIQTASGLQSDVVIQVQ